jgi:hypothetical protein
MNATAKVLLIFGCIGYLGAAIADEDEKAGFDKCADEGYPGIITIYQGNNILSSGSTVTISDDGEVSFQDYGDATNEKCRKSDVGPPYVVEGKIEVDSCKHFFTIQKIDDDQRDIDFESHESTAKCQLHKNKGETGHHPPNAEGGALDDDYHQGTAHGTD